MRILAKLPSRSRPDKCLETINRFQSHQSTNSVTYLVTLDEDDPCLSRYQQLLNRPCVKLDISRSKTKIEAYNSNIPDEGWDILILISDDMIPVTMGWDSQIINDMKKHWPNKDGTLCYPDGHRKDDLMVMPVLGYNYYKKFGYAYHPAYKSLWCDNELTEVAKKLNRFAKINNLIIEHRHPVWTREPPDALLKHNDSYFHSDKAIYQERQARNFDLKPVLLSIGIPTLPKRDRTLQLVLNELNRQINNHPQSQQIEIIVFLDNGELNIAEKRNHILDRSIGLFNCSVDDDDMVTPIYIEEILRAINENPDADCLSLDGIITFEGTNPKRFTHSLHHGRYYETSEAYFRTPNHLNPVRTEITKKIRFENHKFGEDTRYAQNLMASGLLKKEAPTKGILYLYQFSPRNTTTRL